MIELLLPLERFLHANLGEGILRSAFFHLFRFFHLYLPDYADYLLFGLFAVLPYYIVPKVLRVHYLIAVSFGMISYIYSVSFAAALLLFPVGIFFVVHWIAAKAERDEGFRKKAAWGLSLFILFFYGLLLARESFEWTPYLPFIGEKLHIPIIHRAGIAFMLPKLLHFVIDTLYGKIRSPKLSSFALFMIFFPILRLGPIERFQNFSRDIHFIETNNPKRFDIGYGVYRILLGTLKLALYTSVLYPFREEATASIDAIVSHSWGFLYFTVLVSITEVYFHFGGYSDVAIGFSRLFGFKVMENFYLPMFARNLGEWWRRWHISLSFWLRDYVYRPLGGAKNRPLLNVTITFVICGAWHYIAINYIIWGLLQGLGLAGWRIWSGFWPKVREKRGYFDSLKPFARWMHERPRISGALAAIVTFHYFGITGAFFVMEWKPALVYVCRLLSFGAYGG